MLGEICALSAALCWAFSVILFKRSEAISPQGLNLFKNVVSAVLLSTTMLVLGEGFDVGRPAADWWRLLVSGVLGIAVADTFIFMALRRLGAGLLAVVDCAYAPTMVLLSVLLLDEPFGVHFAIGAVLVVGGVLVAVRFSSSGDSANALPRSQLLAGIACGLFGIVSMAVGVMLVKPVLERSGLVEVTLIRVLAGVVGQLLWIAVRRDAVALRPFRPSPVWRTLLPAAVLGSYISMLFWLGGFKWADASVASVLNQMSAVFTILLARVILGEHLSLARAFGSAAAVAGAMYILV